MKDKKRGWGGEVLKVENKVVFRVCRVVGSY